MITGDPPGIQGTQATAPAVFGDLRQQAARLLQPPQHPDPGPGPQQVLELTFALRRVTHVLTRFLEDPMFSVGVLKGAPDAWTEALNGCRGALRDATKALHCRHCVRAWPELRERPGPGSFPAGSLASRLEAAATALTVSRDLMQTHFTTPGTGVQEERSEWAPVITSAPSGRALLAGLADHARAAGLLFWPLTVSREAGSRTAAIWRHIIHASRALQSLDFVVMRAQHLAPVGEDDMRLLDAIPLNTPPELQMPSGSEPVAALCAGTVGTAQRARHALRGSADRARWAPDLTAESMRQTAACCVVTSLNCEIVFRSLAKQASQLGYGGLIPDLRDAANNAVDGRQAWLAVARTWDDMTTDSRGRLSPGAVETERLALWTGRLAYADPQWTPARGWAHKPRQPGLLAANPAEFSSVITAMHYAADALTRIAVSGQDQVLAAAGAGRLHMPARPPSRPVHENPYAQRKPQPLMIAAGSQVEAAFAAYASSAAAGQGILHGAAHLAEAVEAPSRVLATAARHAGYAQRLGTVGQVERAVLDLGERDPELLRRAARADRETRAVLAAARASRSGARAIARPPVPDSPELGGLSSLATAAGRFLAELESGADDTERHRPVSRDPEPLELEP